MSGKNTFYSVYVAALLVTLMLSGSRGAVVYTETFGSGLNGWDTRDGELAVSQNGSVGNSLPSMEGVFAGQDPEWGPIPETDAFRISSGANFVGDYSSMGDGLTKISFQVYADPTDYAPSDLSIWIVDGDNYFSYYFNVASFLLSTWNTFSVDLAWSFGWSGPSESAFTTALSSVDALEIQLTRSGTTNEHSFFVDNIITYDDPLEPPNNSAVPEPGSGLGFLMAAALFYGIRMTRQK